MKNFDPSLIEKALVAAVEKTFSDMAFIDTVKLNAMQDDPFDHTVAIEILHPTPLRITIFLPLECKKMIAENVYGRNFDDLNLIEIDDCLLEMLNVLTGNFLNEYYGDKIKHDISLPEIIFDLEDEEEAEILNFFFSAEGNPFKISFASEQVLPQGGLQ